MGKLRREVKTNPARMLVTFKDKEGRFMEDAIYEWRLVWVCE